MDREGHGGTRVALASEQFNRRARDIQQNWAKLSAARHQTIAARAARGSAKSMAIHEAWEADRDLARSQGFTVI